MPREIYGNTIGEDGWPFCTIDECDDSLIPGTNVSIPLQAGQPNTIMKAFAADFSQFVEDLNGRSDVGGWTATNSVSTSNHLGGTAMDLRWDDHPMGDEYAGYPPDQIATIRDMLNFYEGTIFWGNDWDSPKDSMHYQMGYNTFQNDHTQDFINRKIGPDGLSLYRRNLDPNAFPLPPGYYWGPVDGPEQSISGEYPTDPQPWKDGLGRWQQTLGLPVTKRWNDGATPQAAYTIQQSQGWPPNPDFGYGGVYQGEWDIVINHGWRLPPGWNASVIVMPGPSLTKWGDYSEFQAAIIDDTYPYEQVSLRASSGDYLDAHFQANMAAAKDMVRRGRLKKIIAYHFWVPGVDNWGVFQSCLDQSGGVFQELGFMLDVEDGRPTYDISGDQSDGTNDFIAKGQAYFGNPLAASGYINFNADSTLWQNIPPGLKLVIPDYNADPGGPVHPDGVNFFGWQYADDEGTLPFGPSDINRSGIDEAGWLQCWGVNTVNGQPAQALGAPLPPPPPPPPPAPAPAPVPTTLTPQQVIDAISTQFSA